MIPSASAAQLASLLESIAPRTVATGLRVIDDADVRALLPEELAAVANAVPVRRAEFASGRVLLRALIGTDRSIPVGPDRAPVLPPGVAASLAHDRDVVVAAVSRTPGVVLGIDVEPVTPLTPEVAELVLRADEAGIDAHLAFVLKEAAYKAWSRRGGRMLEHHEVRLTVDPRVFSAEVVDEGVRLDGSYVSGADKWLALVVADVPIGCRRDCSDL